VSRAMWPCMVQTRIASAFNSLAITAALLTSFSGRGHPRLFDKVRAAAAFDPLGDAVEHLNALERIFADGGFAAEHDGVSLLEDGVGDIGNFCAGGIGEPIMLSSMCVATMTGGPGAGRF